VQVDLMKSTLKAPKSKLLNPEHETVFSNYAFKSNLRCYNEVLINTLNNSKLTSGMISTRLVEAEETEKSINETRETYRPAEPYTRSLFSST